jgi:hypothetical protein
MGLAAEKTPDFLNNEIEDKIEPIKPELPVVRHENSEWLEKTKEELDKMAGELFKQKEKDPGKTVEFEKKLFDYLDTREKAIDIIIEERRKNLPSENFNLGSGKLDFQGEILKIIRENPGADVSQLEEQLDIEAALQYDIEQLNADKKVHLNKEADRYKYLNEAGLLSDEIKKAEKDIKTPSFKPLANNYVKILQKSMPEGFVDEAGWKEEGNNINNYLQYIYTKAEISKLKDISEDEKQMLRSEFARNLNIPAPIALELEGAEDYIVRNNISLDDIKSLKKADLDEAERILDEEGDDIELVRKKYANRRQLMLALRLTITVAGLFMGTATAFAEDDHNHDTHADSAGITNAPEDLTSENNIKSYKINSDNGQIVDDIDSEVKSYKIDKKTGEIESEDSHKVKSYKINNETGKIINESRDNSDIGDSGGGAGETAVEQRDDDSLDQEDKTDTNTRSLSSSDSNVTKSVKHEESAMDNDQQVSDDKDQWKAYTDGNEEDIADKEAEVLNQNKIKDNSNTGDSGGGSGETAVEQDVKRNSWEFNESTKGMDLEAFVQSDCMKDYKIVEMKNGKGNEYDVINPESGKVVGYFAEGLGFFSDNNAPENDDTPMNNKRIDNIIEEAFHKYRDKEAGVVDLDGIREQLLDNNLPINITEYRNADGKGVLVISDKNNPDLFEYILSDEPHMRKGYVLSDVENFEEVSNRILKGYSVVENDGVDVKLSLRPDFKDGLDKQEDKEIEDNSNTGDSGGGSGETAVEQDVKRNSWEFNESTKGMDLEAFVQSDCMKDYKIVEMKNGKGNEYDVINPESGKVVGYFAEGLGFFSDNNAPENDDTPMNNKRIDNIIEEAFHKYRDKEAGVVDLDGIREQLLDNNLPINITEYRNADGKGVLVISDKNNPDLFEYILSDEPHIRNGYVLSDVENFEEFSNRILKGYSVVENDGVDVKLSLRPDFKDGLDKQEDKEIEEASDKMHTQDLPDKATVELATVGNGEGVSHAIMRQLAGGDVDDKDYHPDAGHLKSMGYGGDVNDKDAIDDWARKTAGKIVHDEGYFDTAKGTQTWVMKPGESAYLLNGDADSGFTISEFHDRDGDGKIELRDMELENKDSRDIDAPFEKEVKIPDRAHDSQAKASSLDSDEGNGLVETQDTDTDGNKVGDKYFTDKDYHTVINHPEDQESERVEYEEKGIKYQSVGERDYYEDLDTEDVMEGDYGKGYDNETVNEAGQVNNVVDFKELKTQKAISDLAKEIKDNGFQYDEKAKWGDTLHKYFIWQKQQNINKLQDRAESILANNGVGGETMERAEVFDADNNLSIIGVDNNNDGNIDTFVLVNSANHGQIYDTVKVSSGEDFNTFKARAIDDFSNLVKTGKHKLEGSSLTMDKASKIGIEVLKGDNLSDLDEAKLEFARKYGEFDAEKINKVFYLAKKYNYMEQGGQVDYLKIFDRINSVEKYLDNTNLSINQRVGMEEMFFDDPKPGNESGTVLQMVFGRSEYDGLNIKNPDISPDKYGNAYVDLNDYKLTIKTSGEWSVEKDGEVIEKGNKFDDDVVKKVYVILKGKTQGGDEIKEMNKTHDYDTDTIEMNKKA